MSKPEYDRQEQVETDTEEANRLKKDFNSSVENLYGSFVNPMPSKMFLVGGYNPDKHEQVVNEIIKTAVNKGAITDEVDLSNFSSPQTALEYLKEYQSRFKAGWSDKEFLKLTKFASTEENPDKFCMLALGLYLLKRLEQIPDAPAYFSFTKQYHEYDEESAAYPVVEQILRLNFGAYKRPVVLTFYNVESLSLGVSRWLYNNVIGGVFLGEDTRQIFGLPESAFILTDSRKVEGWKTFERSADWDVKRRAPYKSVYNLY